MSAETSAPLASAVPVTPPPRRLTWLRRIVVFIVLSILLVAAAPTLIARTGLRHQLFALARPGMPDGVTIGEATIGWFSPVVFQDVHVPDLTGGPLLDIAAIRTDRPLWELATRPDDIGRLIVDSPTITLQLKAGGSNLQDLLDRFESAPARRSRPRLRFECQGGTLTVLDEQRRTMLTCAEVKALFDDLRQGESPAKASLSLATTAPTPLGRISAQAEWTPAASESELVGPGAVELQVEQWPLDPLLPLLRQTLGAAACAGEISLTVRTTWEALGDAGGQAELDVMLSDLEAALQPADLSAPPLTIATRDAGLRLSGTYDGTADRLTLTNSRLHSEWVDAALRGTLSDLRGTCLCDLSGDVRIKLPALTHLLPPHIQQQVHLEGLETRQVALRGPLRSPADTTSATPQLVVEADIVWQLLEAFGVASQDAEVKVSGTTQRIETTPTRVPVSGGRVASVPAVELTAAGPVLEFGNAPLLEQVAFSPAMCRGWMRYLSPLMADTTSIDGQFSLSVDPARLPLAQWPQVDLSGTLAIHSARVGPGPLTQQILSLVQQIRGLTQPRGPAAPDADRFGQWLTIADQQVHFTVQHGRVTHRDLQLFVGPVRLESSGSVGLEDDSLDLQVRMRLPDSWFADRPLLASLRGDGLVIPIRGTLSQPQLEQGVLRDFGRGVGLRAADGLLQRLLQPDEPRP